MRPRWQRLVVAAFVALVLIGGCGGARCRLGAVQSCDEFPAGIEVVGFELGIDGRSRTEYLFLRSDTETVQAWLGTELGVNLQAPVGFSSELFAWVRLSAVLPETDVSDIVAVRVGSATAFCGASAIAGDGVVCPDDLDGSDLVVVVVRRR